MRRRFLFLLISTLQSALYANPDPANITLELVVGPTNTELLATARMIIHNNDPIYPLVGGSYVDGVFIPCWKFYVNGLYTHANTEKKAVFSKNMIVPTEDFGTIPPGGSIEIACVSDSSFSGIYKLSKATNMAGAHISFNGESKAHFVSLKVRMNENDRSTFSRLPEQFLQQGIADTVALDTPTSRYSQGVVDLPLSLQDRIVPRPAHLFQEKGELQIAQLGAIHADPSLLFEANYLKDFLQQEKSVPIFLHVAETLIPELDFENSGTNVREGYILRISMERVEIVGSDCAGLFYGIQTFRQLLSQGRLDGTHALPIVVITDAPRFPVRSSLLDVARHFVQKQDLLRYIDLLSLFKINRLHLHLSDNEGWRIEIPSIPELVEYGSLRTFNPDSSCSLEPSFGSTRGLQEEDNIVGKPLTVEEANFGVKPSWQGFEDAVNNFVGDGSGYYSVKDFEEILRYAANRHIEILVEIDMPAHAGAAIAAMEHRYQKYTKDNPEKAAEYRLIDPQDASPYKKTAVNPCMPGAFAFMKTVIKEIKARYEAVGLDFKTLHIGADETPGLEGNATWSKSPLCAASKKTSAQLFSEFVVKLNDLVNAQGATSQIWAEALDVIRKEDAQLYTRLKQSRMLAEPWINAWGPKQSACYELANDDFPVILSHVTNLYLSMMQAKNPDELGTSFAGFIGTEEVFSYVPENYVISYITRDFFGDPKNTQGSTQGQIIDPVRLLTEQARMQPEKARNIQGIEASLWTKACKTYQSVEYMSFPRILAAAERAWNRNPPIAGYIDHKLPPESIKREVEALRENMHQAWQLFANALGKYTLPMLDFYSEVTPVNYRVQPPGAIIKNGMLFMNSLLPGLTLQYSIDMGKTWHTWTAPTPVGENVLVKSMTRNGISSRTEALSF